jgi:class 3 adenylate cyclase/TolB-like protein/tetratricopeptide (TPR) repeat protein
MSQSAVGNDLHERRLSAILAADVAGYSRLMGADEEGTLQALKAHRRAVVDPAIANHRGRIVKTTGDGMLVEFASAVDAVRCAVDIQRNMAERNEAVPPERRIQFRIGINVGDIIGDGSDIYGDGVNVAARLEGMAEPGGIWVSQAVRDPVRDKLSFSFEDLGNVSAKNIARPIHVFRVRHDTETTRSKLAPPLAARRLVIAALAVLVVAAAGAGAWFWRERTSPNAPPPLSLVVLPFENIGGDAADNYLATGITDDLTTALSHIPGAFVITRATAYTYRGKAEDIRKIGRDLNVRYVVRGGIQRHGQLLKVNAELGSTETGAQLWSDSFDQKISDLAAGQEQIVVRMRVALNISLADIEAARSLRERPTNPEAFDLILRARAIEWQPATKDTVGQALKLYEQALELDPNAVPALTGAANGVMNLSFYEALPEVVALDRAMQYLARARALEPNSESVLVTQAAVLDWEADGLDYRRARSEGKAVAQKLIDLYPSNTAGYFRLGVIARDEGQYDAAAEYFMKTIRLNPRSSGIKNLYWNMAFTKIYGGHDREGLEWADRTMAAEGTLPSFRIRGILFTRAVAHYRTGDVEAAKRLVRELNEKYPLDTWREHFPDDPDSETVREQTQSVRDALKEAGNRDHLDPNADFGVAPDEVLHLYSEGKTPMTAPGVATTGTEQLASMLGHDKPLVIDTMDSSWYRSVPGAVGLDFHGNTHGTFTDETQKRLERKLQELTGGDMGKPIVAVAFNVARFDGYNLALRIRHAGYTNVYWYRAGREAWEVAGKPEDVVRPADW